MTITTSHPASRYGVPVILDVCGKPMPPADGVMAARRLLGLSRADFAERCGVSPRTVEAWEQGRRDIEVAALNVLADLLRSASQEAQQ